MHSKAADTHPVHDTHAKPVYMLHPATHVHSIPYSGPILPALGPTAHLSSSALQRFVCDECVGDLELDVADGLVTQRTLTRAPLEALHRPDNGSRRSTVSKQAVQYAFKAL